jgi:hypothetical protein
VAAYPSVDYARVARGPDVRDAGQDSRRGERHGARPHPLGSLLYRPSWSPGRKSIAIDAPRDNPTAPLETDGIESLQPEREDNDLRDWLACRQPLPTQNICRTLIA